MTSMREFLESTGFEPWFVEAMLGLFAIGEDDDVYVRHDILVETFREHADEFGLTIPPPILMAAE